MPKPSVAIDHEVAHESEQRQRALEASGVAVESVARPQKRRFSAAEKFRLVKKADECLASGKRGSLETMFREENIYSSLLSGWRLQLGAHGALGLDGRKAGRKPKLDAKDRRNAELAKRNVELERKLLLAEKVIALQKKAHEILGIALPNSDGEI